MLFGHVVEFEPAVLAVHDALGTQDVAVVAAVQLVEHVLKSFLAELLRRLLAPGGEDVVGVVMMVMVALALGIVALLTVVVMVVMLVLVVLVMVMVVMMPMLMVMLILIVVMMVLMFVVVLVMFIVIVMMVMLMLVLGLFDLVLAAHFSRSSSLSDTFSMAERMVLPSSSSHGVVRMAASGFFSRSIAAAASSFSCESFCVRERMIVPAASIWLL